AILFAVSSNGKHGLRRTAADKRKAVMALLLDSVWSKWSDNFIAGKAVVSGHTVTKIRQELVSQGSIPEAGKTRLVQRCGTIYEMDTSPIGERQSTAQAVSPIQKSSPP